MSRKHIILTLFVLTFAGSCQLNKEGVGNTDNYVKRYCGYELSLEEFNEIGDQTFNQNPYSTENSSETFLEIYNTVKNNIDSSIIYELTLAKLKTDEIWLDLKIPKNSNSIVEIGCLIMNNSFSEIVPKQIKIRISEGSLTNQLGMNDKLLAGIKRLK